ncbi:hypothetical protein MBLNU230_g3033t1 [Neophaeotheca triangularis]
MADADEDTIPKNGPSVGEDIDLSDETQDFRFLANFSSSKDAPKIPKRGEKDFEPHATKLQDNSLAASRQAMHNALAHERIHQPKSHVTATYHPETNMAYAYNPKGPHFAKMGQVLPAAQDPLGNDKRRGQRIWLLPEEALYLVERGTLDVRWPSLDPDAPADDQGPPMSLQAAYAMFVGGEEAINGHLTFERYAVYAGLKRMGYTILRAPTWNPTGPPPPPGPETYPPAQPAIRTWHLGLLRSLYSILLPRSNPSPSRAKTGPLVPPATYTTYPQIYALLHLIPSHHPLNNPYPQTPAPSSRLLPTFHLYKPSNPHFRKTAPGAPDFVLVVLNAATTCMPSLQQMDDLISRQPYFPPREGGQMYGRLRQGWKSVVLAVVDRGVVSYLRLGDAGFGGERLYERVGGPGRGGKGGGGRGGRGGARGGRGRGRGR